MRDIFPNMMLFLLQAIILKCCHLKMSSKINFIIIIIAIIIVIFYSELRPTCKAYL